MNINWTKEEFQTYVLLYAAQSNYIETESESSYILSKVNEAIFNRIHTEIVHDNDYQAMEKIKSYLADNKYTTEDKENLLKDIKNVFFADGSVDILERNVFIFLKKIIE
ncbi:hypothetical protein MPF19_05165 [Polaribacter sp. Z014]|uniref:hypothetical protein n=1 Tax=unclassified Polaribacter TaxID=196858 RepID=UPI00193AE8D5|nr:MULTISPECIES: hypothetical protein [unclassified Polaribacter]MCL7762797.1 hypothetical protein [Polaribacter sp. Z014]QVY66288.1 hypothetical protein JOP69_03045 [Polaribacter sp. Q13]